TDDFGGVGELLRGLEFPIRMDHLCAPFALRFRLFCHRPLHFLRKIDMLQLDKHDFNSPGFGLGVQDLLNPGVDFFPLGQKLIQLCLAANTAQRYLRELRSGKEIVLDFPHRAIRFQNSKIEHGIDFYRHVIPRDYVLRRDVHGDRAKIHANHLFNARNDVDHPRTSGPYHSAKSKNDGPFVLFENFDATYDRNNNKNDNCNWYSQTEHICLPLYLRCPTRQSPYFEVQSLISDNLNLFTHVDLTVSFSVPQLSTNEDFSCRIQFCSDIADLSQHPVESQRWFRFLRAIY